MAAGKDQADTLRRLMRERGHSGGTPEGIAGELESSRAHVSPSKVITFASGKGGVGKTCLAANLSAQLARQGSRVLLVDGDSGLANLDIVLGVSAGATFEQVLDGTASLQEAILGIEPNLWLLPAAAGMSDLREADEGTRRRMLDFLERCPWEMDAILVDAGAGIQNNVLSLHSPLHESVVVVTPEPTSITDAYGLIKMLRRHRGVTQVSVIVNQVTGAEQARSTFKKLKDVADRFMDVGMEYLGHCPRDEKFSESVIRRKILLDLDEGAVSVPSLGLLAKRLQAKLPQFAHGALGAESLEMGPRMSLTRNQDDAPAGSAGNTARFWKTLLGQ